MTTDRELLRLYAQRNSQDAFTELVRRHVNLVYGNREKDGVTSSAS
jgi:hypothetical protein